MEHIKVRLSELFPEGSWDVSASGVGASKQAFIANNGERKAFVKVDVASPALKRLAELSVAPPLLFDGSSEEKPFVIQEFVEGESPNRSWFKQNIEQLAHFIKKYHRDSALKEIVGRGTMPSYEENIVEVLCGLDDDIEKSNSDLLKTTEVKEVVQQLKEKSRQLKPVPLVPTHSDPNPQNILVTYRGLMMVDWDDIFLSDPMKDIGLILWWYIPKEKWPDFFSAYGSEMDEEKLRWWIARNTLSIASWYGKQGNSEYVKYFVDDAFIALEGKDNSQNFSNSSE